MWSCDNVVVCTCHLWHCFAIESTRVLYNVIASTPVLLDVTWMYSFTISCGTMSSVPSRHELRLMRKRVVGTLFLNP